MAKVAGHFGQSYDPPSTGLSKLPAGYISTKDYELPVTDVQTDRRNFPGYAEANYFTLQDIATGDTPGTTDTDAETHKSSDYVHSGYTKTYAAYKNASRTKGGKSLSIGALGAGRI